MKALYLLAPAILGSGLDLLLGDPAWPYHPVRLVGRLIGWMENVLRRAFPATQRGELAAGIALALLLPGVVALSALGISLLAMAISPWLWLAWETAACYFLLAARSLREESMAVHAALIREDIPSARTALSRIVGRETACLEPPGIIRAAVETVAENTSDGVIAPLFYFILGGGALGWYYKAVNTLDSMVGYKNERYLWFGKASARLDDLLNWIPARISALAMVAAACLTGRDCHGAWRIWRRDRARHASPNSAQTESACAGALGLKLGGDAVYFGKVCRKPAIGEDTRPPRAEDIPAANRLMIASSALCLVVFTLCKTVALMLLYE